MKNGISKFLPKSAATKAAVHAEIDAELHKDLREQFTKDKAIGIKMTWETFIESAGRAYLEERKNASKA